MTCNRVFSFVPSPSRRPSPSPDPLSLSLLVPSFFQPPSCELPLTTIRHIYRTEGTILSRFLVTSYLKTVFKLPWAISIFRPFGFSRLLDRYERSLPFISSLPVSVTPSWPDQQLPRQILYRRISEIKWNKYRSSRRFRYRNTKK